MTTDSNSNIIREQYESLGKPGGYSGEEKLYFALKDKGYRISREEINKTLSDIRSYSKHKTKYKLSFPKHIPERRTFPIRDQDLFWYGDSAYIKGYKGVYAFFQVYVDGFSRRIFGRPLAKLTAANSVKVLQDIVETDNNHVWPRSIQTDRGSEFHGQYMDLLKEKGVRQIFTNASQKNKVFFAENAIRIVKRLLSRAYEDGGRDLKEALKGVIETYNNSMHTKMGLSPLDAEKDENRIEVLDNRARETNKFLASHYKAFEKYNKQLKVGSIVRVKLPKGLHDKESKPRFSDDLYRVIKIRPTGFLNGYVLSPLDTDIIMPGSYAISQLLKVS